MPFIGFDLPTSNTTFCPNQFFDVCLPHSSRGVVRLVAFMIRKTLGWCDADGDPQEERLLTSYQELIHEAGISREMIKEAIDEAIASHFIRCVRSGRPKLAGQSAISAVYELCWDSSGRYVKDPKQFRGFFEGEGHRTDIPNQFFDRLVPQETLSVIKVVGSIIRLSIGFQDGRGRRRQNAKLSYQHIQNYTRIKHPSSLAEAIRHAITRRYILCLEPGVFDTNAGRDSRPAVYTLRWVDSIIPVPSDQENNGRTVRKTERQIGQKNRAADRSEKPSGIGQKNRAADRSEKPSDIETKQRNETYKQQQAPPVAVADAVSLEKLLKAGFSEPTAHYLAESYPTAQIRQQIDWLNQRSPTRNRLGMLRRAIEENWPKPQVADQCGLTHILPEASVFASHFYAGYGNNQGVPAAPPSSNDLTTADKYVRMLLEVWPNKTEVPNWGRALGQLYRNSGSDRGGAIVSLVVALRTCGDQFLARHRQAREDAIRTFRQRSQSQYEAEHRPAWLAYLAAMEEQYQSQRSTDYARFLTWRHEQREKIKTSRWLTKFSESLLASFDNDEKRRLAFRDFFRDEVRDFWAWDEQRRAVKTI